MLIKKKKINNNKDSKKKVNNTTGAPVADIPKEKTTPAFLRDDYPYKAIGHPILDIDSLEPSTIYEIKCHQCEMSIRSQGAKIKPTYERLVESGCIGCGNTTLEVKRVDMGYKNRHCSLGMRED